MTARSIVVGDLRDRGVRADAADGLAFLFTGYAAPANSPASTLRKSSPPIVPRRADAPTTATARGWKKGRSDATTATWSRWSTRWRRSRWSRRSGTAISTVPSATRASTSRPAPAKTFSIATLPGSTSATKRSIPASPASAASRSSRRVPIPRPCTSSATANAASAERGSRRRTQFRARRRLVLRPRRSSAPRSTKSGSTIAPTSALVHGERSVEAVVEALHARAPGRTP